MCNHETTTLGVRVNLKLENAQQTGSFKIRGIGHLCQKSVQNGCKQIVSSSGGNAGLAAAYSARKLSVPATIVVPSTTPTFMRNKMAAEGAKVIVHGDVWAQAHEYAMKLATEIPNTQLIHPFDHPDVWEGNASLILEAATQLERPPSAVICVVGGGGLLCGVLEGMHKVGWEKVPVLACETLGANKLAQSLETGQLVTLTSINTIAKTLGASQVCAKTLEWSKKHEIISCVCSDEEALAALLEFQKDHQALVEPSCAAGLSLLYDKEQKYLSNVLKRNNEAASDSVLVIVCGGNMVNLDEIERWKKIVNKE